MKSFALVLVFAAAAMSAAVDNGNNQEEQTQTLKISTEALFCECSLAADRRQEMVDARQNCRDNNYGDHDGLETCVADHFNLLNEDGREVLSVSAFEASLGIEGLAVDIARCFNKVEFPGEPDNSLFQWGKRVRWETLEEALDAFFVCYEEEAILNGCVKSLEDKINSCSAV